MADNITKTRHKPNKELIGQGIGNSVAAIFGGIPGAGATIRTVVNVNAGGKTRLSGMISSLLLLVILFVLSPVASQIPAAVLAGILITVGIGVMDYKGLKAIPFMPRDTVIKIGKLVLFKVSSEVVIMLVVLILSSVWNLVYAVGIGLVFASLMFMKKIGDLTSSRSSVKSLSLSEEIVWPDEVNFPTNLKEEVFIKHISGPLFFGSTSDFQSLAKQIPDTATAVIIRLDRMRYIDQSGLNAMEEVLLDLVNKKIKVVFIHLLEQPRYLLEKIDLIPDLIPENQIFNTFEDTLVWIKENVRNNDINN